MLKRFLGRFAPMVLVVAALAGCGDSPSQTGDFATVEVTASAAGGEVVSNVGIATSSTGNYTLTSTPYALPPTSSGSVASSYVAFDQAWVTLAPANSWTPELPEQYRIRYVTAPPRLAPGGAYPGTAEVVSPALKEHLKTLAAPSPTAPYRYWATFSFRGVEESSDIEEIISTPNSTLVTFTGF